MNDSEEQSRRDHASTDNSTDDPQQEPADRREQTDESVERAHPREIGGRKGPDPVRYGDWEKNGRCIDF